MSSRTLVDQTVEMETEEAMMGHLMEEETIQMTAEDLMHLLPTMSRPPAARRRP